MESFLATVAAISICDPQNGFRQQARRTSRRFLPHRSWLCSCSPPCNISLHSLHLPPSPCAVMPPLPRAFAARRGPIDLTLSSPFLARRSSTANRWPTNFTSPNGRIPFVLVDNEMIADSLFAYGELVKRGLAKDLDDRLSDKDLALSRCVMALVTTLVRYLEKERYVRKVAAIRNVLPIPDSDGRWIDNYTFSRDKVLERLWWPIRPALAYLIYRDASRTSS